MIADGQRLPKPGKSRPFLGAGGVGQYPVKVLKKGRRYGDAGVHLRLVADCQRGPRAIAILRAGWASGQYARGVPVGAYAQKPDNQKLSIRLPSSGVGQQGVESRHRRIECFPVIAGIQQ